MTAAQDRFNEAGELTEPFYKETLLENLKVLIKKAQAARALAALSATV